MRLSPHLLMNDKIFTVYMSSRPLANTASELTLAAAGRALADSYHTIRDHVTSVTSRHLWLRGGCHGLHGQTE